MPRSPCLRFSLVFAAIAMLMAAPRSLAETVRLETVPAARLEPRYLLPVNIRGYWGHISGSGKLVGEPRFEWTDRFFEDGRNRRGRLDRGRRFHDTTEDRYSSRARVVQNGLTGYVYKDGSWFLAPRYLYADRFKDGYAIVGDGAKYGVINLFGDPLTPLAFDQMLRFNESLAAAQAPTPAGPRIGFIGTNGKWAIEPRFIAASSFHDGLASVQLPPTDDRPGLLGYIRRDGRFQFLDEGRQFAELGDFHTPESDTGERTEGSGLAAARVGERWGYIDKTFKLRIEPQFDHAGPFMEGYAVVGRDGQWGVLNRAMRLAMQPPVDWLGDRLAFADPGPNWQTDSRGRLARWDPDVRLFPAGRDGRYGFLRLNGQSAFDAAFADVTPFLRRYARFELDGGFGYIDPHGTVAWSPRWPEEHGVEGATLPGPRERPIRFIWEWDQQLRERGDWSSPEAARRLAQHRWTGRPLVYPLEHHDVQRLDVSQPRIPRFAPPTPERPSNPAEAASDARPGS